MNYFYSQGNSLGDADCAKRTDHLLASLYIEGFVVAPIATSKPARRGKGKHPALCAPYKGPAMIGRSHTARLVNGE